MDRIDRATTKAFREQPRARRVAERYGLARFRQRVRQHLHAGGLAIVRIEEAEPEDVQRAMMAVLIAWDFDGSRPKRSVPLLWAEERQLFAEGFRGQPRRANPVREITA